MSLFKKSIRSGLIKLIDSKIGEAQKEYDSIEHSIDVNLKVDIEQLKAKAVTEKVNQFDRIIKRVIGNVL